MPSTVYKALTFNPGDVLSDYKLDQLSSNLQHFNNMMPKVRYAAHSVTREEQLRIMSGVAVIGAQPTSIVGQQVNFGGFFSTGCFPNISTALITEAHRYASVSVQGLGQTFPDHRGMTVFVGNWPPGNVSKNINRTCYVSWNAMGW